MFALILVGCLTVVGFQVWQLGSAQEEGTPESGSPEAGSPIASPEIGTPLAATPEGSPAAAEPVMVEMFDVAFDPRSFSVPANTGVTVDLVNTGVAVHNFVIDELDVHSGDYQSGETGSVTINGDAGSYQYYCSIPGHKEAGMVGTIRLE